MTTQASIPDSVYIAVLNASRRMPGANKHWSCFPLLSWSHVWWYCDHSTYRRNIWQSRWGFSTLPYISCTTYFGNAGYFASVGKKNQRQDGHQNVNMKNQQCSSVLPFLPVEPNYISRNCECHRTSGTLRREGGQGSRLSRIGSVKRVCLPKEKEIQSQTSIFGTG